MKLAVVFLACVALAYAEEQKKEESAAPAVVAVPVVDKTDLKTADTFSLGLYGRLGLGLGVRIVPWGNGYGWGNGYNGGWGNSLGNFIQSLGGLTIGARGRTYYGLGGGAPYRAAHGNGWNGGRYGAYNYSPFFNYGYKVGHGRYGAAPYNAGWANPPAVAVAAGPGVVQQPIVAGPQ